MSKIFVSWSKLASRQVAHSIADWLPKVLPSAKPWLSSVDIEAGTNWQIELHSALTSCQMGVLCVTSANINSPWLAYEAGAMAALIPSGKIVPVLFEAKSVELSPPISYFQHVLADRNGILRLVLSINSTTSTPVPIREVERDFNRLWPQLSSALAIVPPSAAGTNAKTDRELLEEVLLTVRTSGPAASQPRLELHNNQGRYYSYRIQKDLFQLTKSDIDSIVTADLVKLIADANEKMEFAGSDDYENALTEVKQFAYDQLSQRAGNVDIARLGTPQLIQRIDEQGSLLRSSKLSTMERERAEAHLALAEAERELRMRYGFGPVLN